MKFSKKHNKKLHTRIISAVLLLGTLLSLIPWFALPALSVGEPNNAYVTRDGEKIEELLLPDNEKVTISAACDGEVQVSYRWQIRDKADADRWIDISGAFMQELSVSCAMVESMANDKGEAYIRCVMSGQRTYSTDPLKVLISYTVPVSSGYYVPAVKNQKPKMLSAGPAAVAAEETETPDGENQYTTCSIIINYLFDNNVIAFEPYGATVAYNTGFTDRILSPTVVGYAPFRRVGDDYIDATYVDLNFEHVTQDIVINVIYEPALVKFSVHHHLQNLFNDDYSHSYDYITESYALTGSLVPEGLAFTEEQLPGFNALIYERLPVAADGSTVVEIRYDRKYYLIDFDMNGGYGTEPVYTRYGDSVGANTPVRHGYVFDGWELVSYGGHAPTTEQQSQYTLIPGNTIIVPNANLQYRARWRTTQTTYTMVFWKENAQDNGYTYWGYLDNLGAISGSFVDGQNLISQVPGIDDEQYFTFNSEKTDKNILVEGDGSTVVNVYYTRKFYKLEFDAAGLCTIPEGHQHTAACYDEICGLGHTHNQSCVPTLRCTTPEHTAHTADCIACGLSEHTHGSSACSCQIKEHTHTKSCWGNVAGNQANPYNAPQPTGDGYVYRRNYSNRYIYIKGTWYTYSGSASNGRIVDPTCGYASEHTHGTNCNCPLQAHTHSEACMRDVIHTHTDACYTYSCGQIDHTHNDNCYRLKCGITENHTHSSTCKRSSSTNTVKTVYRKYEQSIVDIWPVTDDNGEVYDNGERWKPSAYYSQVLVFLSKMPPQDITLTLNEATYSPYTMNYYLEVLPGDTPAGKEIVTYDNRRYMLDNTIKAKYNYITRDEDFFDITGFVQYESDPAFSGNGQISISGSNRVANFYYNRITDHKVEFNSNGIVLEDEEIYGLPYGASLSGYDFTPEYPTNLEPNAYTFAGWYTTPLCFDGTEVNWSTLTMPEGDLLLYAKWVPVKHSVKVYLDRNFTTQIGQEQLVDHNAFASAPQGQIVNGNYIFHGWFYLDVVNGEEEEKAFVFTGIPVRDDMKIYAKWGSHVAVEYKINYRLHLTDKLIADSTIGSAIAGNNETFYAKAGDELYEGYRTGFYPLTNSHTITMSVDGTHEFTFDYIYVESMPYRVRYVNADTGEALLPDKVVEENTHSVVTETFVKIPKMMPDAYQKRLVLAAEDSDGDGVYDENVITFYYKPDEVHAYYKVVHYIQNISADGYREYRSVETVGDIGTSYTVNALTLTGFRFDGALTRVDGIVTPVEGTGVSAKLGDDGMLVELYYDRQTYNYTVNYIHGVTGEQILPTKQAEALFGAQVVEYAPDLSAMGYTYSVSGENLKMLTISANTQSNVITFVYTESVVSIKYQVVGIPGCGTLSRNSENIMAISGVPTGSIPTAANGYRFVGWYADVDCTIPVDVAEVDPDTMHLRPAKPENTIWRENTIYYAQFVPMLTELKISNSGWNVIDTDQVFVYRLRGVAGTDTETIDLTFTIHGNGSVTVAQLPVGEYIVTQISDWSWRYEAETPVKQITLSVDQRQNTVDFVNVRIEDKWLDGNNSANNLFS